jgi:hypothetical protein
MKLRQFFGLILSFFASVHSIAQTTISGSEPAVGRAQTSLQGVALAPSTMAEALPQTTQLIASFNTVLQTSYSALEAAAQAAGAPYDRTTLLRTLLKSDFVKNYSNSVLVTMQAELTNAGYTFNVIDTDYGSALQLTGGTTWLGKFMTYSAIGLDSTGALNAVPRLASFLLSPSILAYPGGNGFFTANFAGVPNSVVLSSNAFFNMNPNSVIGSTSTLFHEYGHAKLEWMATNGVGSPYHGRVSAAIASDANLSGSYASGFSFDEMLQQKSDVKRIIAKFQETGRLSASDVSTFAFKVDNVMKMSDAAIRLTTTVINGDYTIYANPSSFVADGYLFQGRTGNIVAVETFDANGSMIDSNSFIQFADEATAQLPDPNRLAENIGHYFQDQDYVLNAARAMLDEGVIDSTALSRLNSTFNTSAQYKSNYGLNPDPTAVSADANDFGFQQSADSNRLSNLADGGFPSEIMNDSVSGDVSSSQILAVNNLEFTSTPEANFAQALADFHANVGLATGLIGAVGMFASDIRAYCNGWNSASDKVAYTGNFLTQDAPRVIATVITATAVGLAIQVGLDVALAVLAPAAAATVGPVIAVSLVVVGTAVAVYQITDAICNGCISGVTPGTNSTNDSIAQFVAGLLDGTGLNPVADVTVPLLPAVSIIILPADLTVNGTTQTQAVGLTANAPGNVVTLGTNGVATDASGNVVTLVPSSSSNSLPPVAPAGLDTSAAPAPAPVPAVTVSPTTVSSTFTTIDTSMVSATLAPEVTIDPNNLVTPPIPDVTIQAPATQPATAPNVPLTMPPAILASAFGLGVNGSGLGDTSDPSTACGGVGDPGREVVYGFVQDTNGNPILDANGNVQYLYETVACS